MEELLAFQQANPNVNLMSEYNRLKNLYGSSFDEIENEGIGPLFNGPRTLLAGDSMYQGIMG
jgi:hypothetical protein